MPSPGRTTMRKLFAYEGDIEEGVGPTYDFATILDFLGNPGATYVQKYKIDFRFEGVLSHDVTNFQNLVLITIRSRDVFPSAPM